MSKKLKVFQIDHDGEQTWICDYSMMEAMILYIDCVGILIEEESSVESLEYSEFLTYREKQIESLKMIDFDSIKELNKEEQKEVIIRMDDAELDYNATVDVLLEDADKPTVFGATYLP